MANTLRFKRGLLAGLPSAAVGEPLFTTDTFDLYIGTASGTQKYQKFIASGTTSQLLRGDGSLLTMPIVLTSPANGQVLKFNGTNWVNDSDAGITGSLTTNYIPRATGASTLGNSTIFQGTRALGINTATPVDFGVGTYNLHLHDDGIPLIHLTNSTTGQSSSVGSRIQSNGNDLLFINSQATGVFRWNTNGAERMRLHSTGNLHLGGTTDNGLRFQVTGDGYFSGSVGINQTSLTQYNLRVSKNITGATIAYGITSDGVIQSDVTSSGLFFSTLANTQNATFTLNNLFHFSARQGTFGASSTITKQVGFFVESSVVGAGTNIGFEGNIASGTGRWNLYMSGSADNYMAGNLLIGTTTNPDGHKLFVNGGRGFFNSGIRLGTGYSAIDVVTGASGLYLSGSQGALNHLFINSSGNLGLGVTPSAWAILRAIQVGLTGNLSGYISSTEGAFFSSNSFYNGGAFVYQVTGNATQYEQKSGRHIWSTAASGTAGTNISFTQAMTLDASGNLAVGTTTTTNRLEVWGSGNTAARIVGQSAGNATLILSSGGVTAYSIKSGNGDSSLRIDQDGTERIMLASGGNLLIGTTTNSTFKLDVNGTMRVSGATTLGDTSSVTLNITGGRAIRISGSLFMDYATGGTGDFIFRSGAGFTERMRLDANGYLGIGTTPTVILDVAGASNLTSRARFAKTGTTKVLQFGADRDTSLLPYIGSESNHGFSIITNNTEVARFDTSGNLGLGVTPSAWGSNYKVFEGSFFSIANEGVSYGQAILGNNAYNDGTSASPTWKRKQPGRASMYVQDAAQTAMHSWFTAGSSTAGSAITFTQAMTLDASGNLGIGTTNPLDRLHVNNGDFFFGNESNVIQNIRFRRNGATVGSIGTYGNQIEINGGSTLGAGHLAITSTGNVGISNTSPSYKLDVTGQARISDAIAIGTTPDTNLPFKILKNINSTVGVRFENTSIGANAFSAVQFGTDVSGGTKFTNIVYGSSGVAQNGVYYPDGTSMINKGTGGLNFYSEGAPIRLFNGGGNGVLKWELVNNAFINHYSGTAPSASVTDGYSQYSADITAGNAAPHFRTENGGIIKLYQQTTAVTSATYIGGAGTTVTDLDTFDGYTIPQIVKALRNAGLLA